jgi:hypothetical protein
MVNMEMEQDIMYIYNQENVLLVEECTCLHRLPYTEQGYILPKIISNYKKLSQLRSFKKLLVNYNEKAYKTYQEDLTNSIKQGSYSK